jgi:hypothetical protein
MIRRTRRFRLSATRGRLSLNADVRLNMKRWTYILVMVLVAATMLALLWWAATSHNVRGYSPAKQDRIIAAMVFWATLLMPISIGLILSLTVANKALHPQWPIFELVVIGFLLLALFGPHAVGRLYGRILPREAIAVPVTYILVVVCIGLSVLNICVGVRNKKWIRTCLSVLIALGGTAVLLINNAWAIYLE